jgi:gliding motility-associated-like protein
MINFKPLKINLVLIFLLFVSSNLWSQSFNISANVDDELCIDYSDGSIILNISGGTGSYSYSWTGPNSFSSTSSDIFNLFPGVYDVIITDNLSFFTKDTSFTIGIGFNMQFTSSINNISCYGSDDGTIDINPINLILPVYNWSDINLSIANRINLAPGIYYLQIDDNNCFVRDTFNIAQPLIISQDIDFELSNYSTYSISCKNGNDGWINATPTGGNAPYSFAWTGPNGYFSNSQNISGLSKGLYSLIVTNGLGCEEQFTFPVSDPQESLTGVVNSLYDYNGYDISCYDYNDGGILFNPIGGVSPYTFFCDNVEVLNPLVFKGSAEYLIGIRDNNGCAWEGNIYLNQPDSITWNINIFPDTCKKEVGEITIDANGGVPPYNYLWSDSQISRFATRLYEGEYGVVVTDDNGCEIFDTVFVPNLISPMIDFTIISDYERLYSQLKVPIVFIDMTELTWQNALYWDWDFGDGTNGTDSIAFHSYQEIGEYDVSLKLTTEYNCIDILTKKVTILEYELFIPNAFTPFSIDDNINSEFKPLGVGINQFLMTIYSRWGQVIFSTNDIEQGWNGKFNNTDKNLQLGVYLYFIEIKDVFGATHKYEGQFTLF